MAKKIKTNALRILDRNKIEYNTLYVEVKDGTINGGIIAKAFGKDALRVQKTLVARGHSKEIYVFIVPLSVELDLKKAAIATQEKKIEMLPHKDLQKYTGYVKGGCSPIGMKKLYKTYINEPETKSEKIIVNGGRIGVLVELSVSDLLEIVNGDLKDLQKA